MSVKDMIILDWARHHLVNGRFRKLILVLVDAIAILSAICLALLLYQQSQTIFQQWSGLWVVFIVVLLIKFPIFTLLGLYRVDVNHIDFEDMTQIFKAVTIGSLLFGIISVLLRGIVSVNLSVIVTDYLFTLMLVGGLRTSKRVYYQLLRQRHAPYSRRVLIAGAGSAGELTLRAMFQEKNSESLPVGMVDDDPTKQGMMIHGVRVFGNRHDIPHLVQKLKVHELLICMPSAQQSVLREIVQLGREAGLKKIRILPALHRLINGKVAASNLRDLQVEDLLGREPVQIDTNEIESYLKDKIVMVTGGAGSIGSELCRQIAAFNSEHLVVLDQDETGLFQLRQELNLHFPLLKLSVVVGDIQDKARVQNIFAYFKPKVVFHAAAYKHVSMMEENPEEAVRNNVLGTQVVCEAAHLYGVDRFVFISTDKAVNPTCIMGATKRLAEIVVQSFNKHNSCRFISVRFGNVLGSRGSVVPIFQEQIQRGGPVTVTHPEMRRYFMTPTEAALLVLQAGAIGNGGEVFVLDMGAPMVILDLAREMIRLAGLDPDKDIPIVFTQPHPGEKLFEDILTAEEGTIATKHQRIYVAKTNNIEAEERMKEALEELKALVGQGERKAIVEALHVLVPSYHSTNGTYNYLLGAQSLPPVSDTRSAR